MNIFKDINEMYKCIEIDHSMSFLLEDDFEKLLIGTCNDLREKIFRHGSDTKIALMVFDCEENHNISYFIYESFMEAVFSMNEMIKTGLKDFYLYEFSRSEYLEIGEKDHLCNTFVARNLIEKKPRNFDLEFCRMLYNYKAIFYY